MNAEDVEREAIVHDNPALAQQIRDGVAEAERGETTYLGSFAQHLEEDSADAEQPPTTAPFAQIIWCTICVIENKQAHLAGKEPTEIHPGVVLATVMLGNASSTVLLCEVRHPLNVEPPKLLIAAPGQMPTNGFGH